ncbi:MAG: phosphopantetheine adenylyltransferase [Methylobacterium sp.]|nr:MAG: phosphopantetheine adenylyltransferase [Methylobacterium sp.]
MSHDDFAFEPVPGLPANLPDGERLLWQGAPAWWPLAWRVFHLREVTAYFLLLMGWTAFSTAWTHGTAKAVLAGLVPVTIAACLAFGLIALIARFSARTSVYSITSERVVMRIGIALPITFNLPFAIIETAAVKQNPDGSGDISLALSADNRLAFLVLWPHARPWHVRRSQPSFRALGNVTEVARILARALAARAPAHAVITELAPKPGPHEQPAGPVLPGAATPAH